jgi:hypothetical protein
MIKNWETQEFGEVFGWQNFTVERFKELLNTLVDEDEK